MEAKVYLLIEDGQNPSVTGPPNPFLAESPPLRISRERALELLEARKLWTDIDRQPFTLAILRFRLARLADTLFHPEDKPRIRAVLERDLPNAFYTPVLVSRLLPADDGPKPEDPGTRDGYLRQELARRTDTFGRSEIAREMIRVNLPGHWETLKAAFFSEKPSPNLPDLRQSILRELGVPPLTLPKIEALSELLDDERLAQWLTQQNRVMGMDYRRDAVASVNAHAGREVLSYQVAQDLSDPARSANALVELRAAAATLKLAAVRGATSVPTSGPGTDGAGK